LPARYYFECGGTILACYEPEADSDDVNGGRRFHLFHYLYFALPDFEMAIKRPWPLAQ